jgi:hypothetical protein
MTKTLYITDENGGLTFHSDRQSGEVRLKNYVFDLWLPILGAEGIGVYGVYCRLEREGTVHGMTMKKIARACRIGTSKLAEINSKLVKYRFVSIVSPNGAKRLMHWTSEITVHDPPSTLDMVEIDADDLPPGGYSILTPWLTDSQIPLGIAGMPKQEYAPSQSGSPRLQPVLLQPLDIADALTRPPENSVPYKMKETERPEETLPSKQIEEPPSKVPLKVSPARPVQPHIALIDAWLAALPGKPAIKDVYGRYARPGVALAAAGVTPEQITAYVAELRKDQFWRGKLITLEHVASNIAVWLADQKPQSAADSGLVPHPDFPGRLVKPAIARLALEARNGHL